MILVGHLSILIGYCPMYMYMYVLLLSIHCTFARTYMYVHVRKLCHDCMCVQMLDEVRAVGSLKKGTALAGNIVADVVVLLRDLPTGMAKAIYMTVGMCLLNC